MCQLDASAFSAGVPRTVFARIAPCAYRTSVSKESLGEVPTAADPANISGAIPLGVARDAHCFPTGQAVLDGAGFPALVADLNGSVIAALTDGCSVRPDKEDWPLGPADVAAALFVLPGSARTRPALRGVPYDFSLLVVAGNRIDAAQLVTFIAYGLLMRPTRRALA